MAKGTNSTRLTRLAAGSVLYLVTTCNIRIDNAAIWQYTVPRFHKGKNTAWMICSQLDNFRISFRWIA